MDFYQWARLFDGVLSLAIAGLFIAKNRGRWSRRSHYPLSEGGRTWRVGLILLFIGLGFGFAYAAFIRLQPTPSVIYTGGFLSVIAYGLVLDYRRLQMNLHERDIGRINYGRRFDD